MTENMKNFLKKVTEDKELGKKVSKLNNEELIALASGLGIALTEADFVQAESALSEDELAAIHGGRDEQDWADFNNCSGTNGQQDCFCAAGGGGQADENGDTCVCVLYGQGGRGSGQTCTCPVIGVGNDDDI